MQAAGAVKAHLAGRQAEAAAAGAQVGARWWCGNGVELWWWPGGGEMVVRVELVAACTALLWFGLGAG